MRIRNLETFVKVAELNSFHAAAKALSTTQPAISARIAALESELNVSLFRRDKGGTQLTSRGRQLLPFAQKMMRIAEEMKSQLNQDLLDVDTVRIGIADTLAELWVAPLLKQWRLDFPHIQFEVVVDLSDHLEKQIEQHQLDMVFMVSQPSNASLMTEYLCSLHQQWIASDEVIEQQNWQNRILDLQQLATCSVLSFPKHTQPWRDLERLFAVLGEAKPMLHTCSSVNHLMNLTQQGLGISLLPEPLALKLVKEKGVRILQTEASLQPSVLNFCSGWRSDDERLLPKLLAASAKEVVTQQGKVKTANVRKVKYVG
ncbi:LysR family transcriptional regulator [Bermanella marisrubri]|uniref:Transcriptional regulators, LysR family protein n=1 Tax=Bermanella marisrubri TaxID=207949 RepID=Q1N2K4_9GAMM|nr:LysR family transcriptional regulator [Bermanella marisrubri]EAT12403.1 transcriptional regulators, LysR family protein [Oceanobacter sp. RED65] [Bermanella marisrubri]QIZ85484.1 LysR family transcriptional regulator [Bermanella marisrubri]